jgi:SpoVK/Ycf46/Vps4 family AAA+-type ATPase
LVAVLEVQAQRRAQGLKVSPMSNHLVLLGAPGTGKTTIARLLGQIMHTLGLLENRHFVEGDRESLVGQHIGESAIKTKALIESAMGGVLFIDEAYSLDPKSNGYSADPFAAEAIATLLKAMEDDRGAFVVMVAGYDKPMQKFLSSNEGLRSRFARTLHFADYTPNELTTIADKMVADADYRWTLDGREAFERGLFYLLDHKDESWANAREVRTLVEHMQRAHAVRIKRVGGRRTRKELRELTTVDVRSAITAFADERQPAAASALRSGSRLTEAQHSS